MSENESGVLPQQTDVSSIADERALAGQLALEVMHEIRNPLETLGYLNYLALNEAEDPEQVRKYLGLAQEQIETLGRVATQTLGYARASYATKPIDLFELAEAALRIHRRTVESRNIHLVRDLARGLMTEAHEGRILQVVSNLIVNALDALPESGTLTLRLRKRGGFVHLIVADNGHGIATEHLERIFERFFSTKEAAGNGLGLSLSKRIVEEHRGKIRLRTSVRPGRSGTMFRMSLPA